MPNIYIVVGDRNTRKSSTIRALTGAWQRGLWNVETLSQGLIKIFIQISSLQEKRIKPQQFINEIRDKKCDYVLVSLQLSTVSNCYNYLTYIQKFQKAGWNIVEIVFLNLDENSSRVNTNNINCKNINFIKNSISQPSNKIASQIRELWKWY